MKTNKITILYFLFATLHSFSQNTETLQAINTQIWEPFTTAFETSDYQLFANLHSDNLVRVNANGSRILKKAVYIEGYKINWEKNNISRTIAFRFLERLNTTHSASERGIYKLTVNPNESNEQHYYGKFHVILVKEKDVWKILVDYDSSEGNTINETTFQNAFSLTDFPKY